MIKKIFILIAMISFTSLLFAIEIVKKEKDEMEEKGITELIITDNKVGDGREAEKGLTVTVHYTGWLYENREKSTKFDSSVDRGQSISFGLNQVIKGWTEGVQLMKEGAKYKFFIPQELAYGANPQGAIIKPFMPLVFEVELIKIN